MAEPREVGHGEKVGWASFHLACIDASDQEENGLGGLLRPRTAALHSLLLKPIDSSE